MIRAEKTYITENLRGKIKLCRVSSTVVGVHKPNVSLWGMVIGEITL